MSAGADERPMGEGEAEVDWDEMERQRRAYDRATPAERRAVISGRPEEEEPLRAPGAITDPEYRGRAAAANPDAIRDRDRPGK
jgi:hypothetical protein